MLKANSRQGAELLTQQLLGFGVEKHDDLVDAFTLLLHRVYAKGSVCGAGMGGKELAGWFKVLDFTTFTGTLVPLC